MGFLATKVRKSMKNRQLEFIYLDTGQIEAIAFGANERRTALVTDGYRDSGIPDLLIDLHPDTQQPYCFMSLNFDKSYPAVIWGLRLLMNEEHFDVPQANLTNVALAEAFSWAYTHFLLEEQSSPFIDNSDHTSLTHHVLHHALVNL